MRVFLLIATFAAAVLTTGLNLTALTEAVPKCALGCAMAGPGQAGCGVLDVDCICSRLPNISALGAPCMVKAGCNLDEIMKTGIVIVSECAKEYARTHNGTVGGIFAMPTATEGAKTGAAAELYGAGWAVMAAAMVAATALLL